MNRTTALILSTLLIAGCAEGPEPWAMRPITKDYTFPARDDAGNEAELTVTAPDLEKGRHSYVHYCYACHGMDGDGQGPSSHGLRPPPRDFRAASFKFGAVRSGELPNDDDLLRIVKGGLHGTAMLAWDVPDDQLWRILQFVKTFPQAPCDPKAQGEAVCKKQEAEFPNGKPSKWLDTFASGKKKGQLKATGRPIPITDDPWAGKAAEAIARGADLYHAKAQCANCHSAYLTKKEYYEASLRIDADNPTTSFRDGMYLSIVLAGKDNPYKFNLMPPDFTLNPLRSIREGEELGDLYRLISAGVGGVMPAWIDGLKQDEIWALAHYVKALMDLGRPENKKALGELRQKLANQPPWSPPSKEPQKVTVGIDDDDKLSLGGTEVASSEALLEELKKLAAGDRPVEVVIEATAKVKQEAVIEVLDKIKAAGIDKVAIHKPEGEGDDDKEGEEPKEPEETEPTPKGPKPEPKAPEPKAPAPKGEPKAPTPKSEPKAPAPKAEPKAPAPKAPAPKAPPGDTPYD